MRLLSSVASRPGPKPPYHALKATLRKKVMKGKSVPMTGSNAQRSKAANAVKPTATP